MVWKERMSEYWMIGLLLFLIAVFSYISPVFATRGNLSNFLRSIPVLGIATLGVAMLMIPAVLTCHAGPLRHVREPWLPIWQFTGATLLYVWQQAFCAEGPGDF